MPLSARFPIVLYAVGARLFSIPVASDGSYVAFGLVAGYCHWLG